MIMASFSFSLGNVLLILAVTFLIGLYKYVTRKSDYWIEKKVAGPRIKPFVGNIWDIITMKSSFSSLLDKFYYSFDEPFIGIFTLDEPALIIRDPELVKQIVGRDFNHFSDRVMYQPDYNKVFANVLFAQKNPKWKFTRSKLTPVFTGLKVKELYFIINGVCEEFITYIRSNEPEQVSRNLCAKFSTEVITRAFFGVKGQCFEKDSVFLRNTMGLFGFTLRNAVTQTLYFFKGSLAKFFKLEFFDRKIEAFFVDTFWKCMKNVEEMEIKPRNFIAILEELRRTDSAFDDTLLVSQGLMFFVAGVDALTSAISFSLYEFSKNPNIQEKVRTEINNVIAENELNFETLKKFTYLELCIKETLRKYPSLSFLDRKCTSDYKIPGTNVIIERETPVYIPMRAIHNDEKYFPEPEKFIPERFLDNVNESKLVYFPFGGGQRACIGERFGFFAVKLALVHILRNFSMETTRGTPNEVKMDPKSVVLSPIGGLPLKFKAL